MDTKKDIKVSVFLDKEMACFIDENKTYGMRRSDYMRGLVWEKMKRKKTKPTVTTTRDPFSSSTISVDMIPDDLKEYAELIVEWWPIRFKNKGTCSTSVAERIFRKLRTFPPKGKKMALEKAIAGGWKDIYDIHQSKIVEEPKNNHPASRVFTAKGGFQ
tara:strand:+ start:124 stop:600 length:477 start_codon:yes stop_codon:yes gene_type:complete